MSVRETGEYPEYRSNHPLFYSDDREGLRQIVMEHTVERVCMGDRRFFDTPKWENYSTDQIAPVANKLMLQ